MKFCKNNLKLSTITLILVLAISATIIALPIATAQPGTTWNTWSICTLTPDVVGVNQPVLVAYGITRQCIWPQPGWSGVTITVTSPDNSVQTLGPFKTDTTGLGGTIFTPTMVGTYTFQTHFPQQILEYTAAGVEGGTTMLASDSDVIELVVNQEPVEYFSASQQPSGYWTRPIDAQNREWEWLAGSWLNTGTFRMSNRIADSNDGPETAHILWDTAYAEGGLVGGDFGMHSFETGDAYEGKWSNPVIVAGILVSRRHTRGTQETFAINL